MRCDWFSNSYVFLFECCDLANITVKSQVFKFASLISSLLYFFQRAQITLTLLLINTCFMNNILALMLFFNSLFIPEFIVRHHSYSLFMFHQLLLPQQEHFIFCLTSVVSSCEQATAFLHVNSNNPTSEKMVYYHRQPHSDLRWVSAGQTPCIGITFYRESCWCLVSSGDCRYDFVWEVANFLG